MPHLPQALSVGQDNFATLVPFGQIKPFFMLRKSIIMKRLILFSLCIIFPFYSEAQFQGFIFRTFTRILIKEVIKEVIRDYRRQDGEDCSCSTRQYGYISINNYKNYPIDIKIGGKYQGRIEANSAGVITVTNPTTTLYQISAYKNTNNKFIDSHNVYVESGGTSSFDIGKYKKPYSDNNTDAKISVDNMPILNTSETLNSFWIMKPEIHSRQSAYTPLNFGESIGNKLNSTKISIGLSALGLKQWRLSNQVKTKIMLSCIFDKYPYELSEQYKYYANDFYFNQNKNAGTNNYLVKNPQNIVLHITNYGVGPTIRTNFGKIVHLDINPGILFSTVF